MLIHSRKYDARAFIDHAAKKGFPVYFGKFSYGKDRCEFSLDRVESVIGTRFVVRIRSPVSTLHDKDITFNSLDAAAMCCRRLAEGIMERHFNARAALKRPSVRPVIFSDND